MAVVKSTFHLDLKMMTFINFAINFYTILIISIIISS